MMVVPIFTSAGSQPRLFAMSRMNQPVSMQWPGLMTRPARVSMNSPCGPTISRMVSNSGFMKYFRSSSMLLSICASRQGSSDTCLRTFATLMSIIVMEWPRASKSNLGGRKPGSASIHWTRLNSCTAFSAYSGSSAARLYSAIAMAAKHSENTYRRFCTGLPSAVTEKNMCPSLSKQWASMKSMAEAAASRHSSLPS